MQMVRHDCGRVRMPLARLPTVFYRIKYCRRKRAVREWPYFASFVITNAVMSPVNANRDEEWGTHSKGRHG